MKEAEKNFLKQAQINNKEKNKLCGKYNNLENV